MNLLQVLLEARTALKSDEGAGMIEYALLVVLIAIVAIVAIGLAGDAVSGTFVTIAGHL